MKAKTFQQKRENMIKAEIDAHHRQGYYEGYGDALGWLDSLITEDGMDPQAAYELLKSYCDKELREYANDDNALDCAPPEPELPDSIK